MIVGYSICYINSKFRLNQIIKPEEGYLNVMYYENFNVKKRKDKNNATYCCFEKELCECFETNFRPTCTQNLRSIDAKRNNFEYCDCKKIPRDPTINCEGTSQPFILFLSQLFFPQLQSSNVQSFF